LHFIIYPFRLCISILTTSQLRLTRPILVLKQVPKRRGNLLSQIAGL
jgi:hypothetical protein